MKRMMMGMALAAAGCGGASGMRVSVDALPVPSVTATVTTSPTVVLLGKEAAVVDGHRVAFDGIEEGLAWPALAKAVHAQGEVSIAAHRETPTLAVLRAVWTLRDADVEVRTVAQSGVEESLLLRRKPSAAAPAGGCHAVVFVALDGVMRVASPGGTVTLTGAHATQQLVSTLDQARAGCPLRYVAFGAEQSAMPWSVVFDAARAVARANAAGDARIVLGEPLRTPS